MTANTAKKASVETMPEAGTKAPSFTLPDQDGKEHSLSDYAGKNIVIYFYPKDATPGCTTEACDFTAQKSDFDDLNTVIFGISKDSIASHKKFVDKQSLKIQLLSDEEGDVCESYGVWGEKNMYGRNYMGITRATFLINKEGMIAQVWPKVSVKGHSDEVLEAAKALN